MSLDRPPVESDTPPVETEWQAGPPSLRAMAPSVVGGALVPLGVYYLVRSHVHGDAVALAIAGAFPAVWVAFEWVRKRRVDPIGLIVLFGFVAGLIASVALGGNAFVLKVRDSAFTSMFGVACLVSLAFGKPLMFFIGRALSAGDDPERRQAFDALLELDSGPRVFAIITATWGIGLIIEAIVRTILAVVLSTGTFLAVSPVWAGVVYGVLFGFTVLYSRVARRRADTVAPAPVG
ncbi:MAG: VC0807 family protein [Acidimicrobiales bacterium]